MSDNPDLVPTPPRGTQMPVSTRPNGRTRSLVAGVIGLVVGAAVVGGAWLLFGNNGASSEDISAPDAIGDYVKLADVRTMRENDRGRDNARQRADWDRRSAERLSTTYDGAGATVQGYSDEDLENMFSLQVVRAQTPFPQYVPYQDAEYMGLDKPRDELLEFGDVACAVNNTTADETFVVSCMRTSDDLTVIISPAGGDLRQDPKKVADLVDDAWSQLS